MKRFLRISAVFLPQLFTSLVKSGGPPREPCSVEQAEICKDNHKSQVFQLDQRKHPHDQGFGSSNDVEEPLSGGVASDWNLDLSLQHGYEPISLKTQIREIDFMGILTQKSLDHREKNNAGDSEKQELKDPGFPTRLQDSSLGRDLRLNGTVPIIIQTTKRGNIGIFSQTQLLKLRRYHTTKVKKQKKAIQTFIIKRNFLK
ncbi:hypothetical protein PGT21_033501 [Puccinia graminis f. sp. tritici]|uniref:Uncharacterized protein n=1 Tax=Puccinia graminis f. sp. tritici TaxID=56615 RepID=A0A5B0QKR6_PUCGR|nr:hypothetical protein PGT21_033501 [Puccinia graminis f. sp. tritici]